MLRPIYYDLETTGTDPKQDQIIEIAAFDPVWNKTFTYLVKPSIPIPPEATAIHTITDDAVAQAPSFREIGSEFISFCSGECVLIAHNNDQFDKLFLAEEALRHQLSLPPWLMIDTLKWARKYRPDLPRHSLQYLRQIYDIAPNNAHRALDDVHVLYQVFSVMIDDLPLEKVYHLLYHQKEAPAGDTMPFGKYQGKPLKEVPASYLVWLKEQGTFEKPEHANLKASLVKLDLL